MEMVGKIALMKGRSHSTRPVSKRPPNWVVYQPDEVKALIINLAREGRHQSEIGGILRDEYGIPLVRPIIGYGVNTVNMLRLWKSQPSGGFRLDVFNHISAP